MNLSADSPCSPKDDMIPCRGQHMIGTKTEKNQTAEKFEFQSAVTAYLADHIRCDFLLLCLHRQPGLWKTTIQREKSVPKTSLLRQQTKKRQKLQHENTKDSGAAVCAVQCTGVCGENTEPEKNGVNSKWLRTTTTLPLPHQRLLDARAALDRRVGSAQRRSTVPGQQYLVQRFRQLLVPVLC